MEDTDLLDRRGRLVRLAIACLLGGAGTTVVVIVVQRLARSPNGDAVSFASVAVTIVAVFLMLTTLAHRGVTAVHDRRRRAP